MSKRHHVIAFVLLSSSAAFASPAETDRDGSRVVRATEVARAELAPFVEARFQTLRDRDGYPLVGNMHGKRADDEPNVPDRDPARARRGVANAWPGQAIFAR